MGIKSTKKRQTTLVSIVIKAVCGIGFGILGFTMCVFVLLSIIAKDQNLTVKVFVNLNLLIAVGYLLIVILLIFLISFLTARKLTRKGQSIINITEKIKAQDLDFVISSSGVKEIDQVLESIDNMRMALKEALEAQWRLEQNRKEQISALAHDFKTPITVLKGNIDLLQNSELSDSCKDYAKDAKTSLGQIESYLTQLLEMTRAEGCYSLYKQKISLVEVLGDVISMFTRLADEKEILILNEKAEGNIFISADQNQLQRVFNNLISNALDFTPQKGTIKITVTKKEDNAVISISDSGCGFSPTALKHGTEQFFMGDASRGRKNHYGLGLYIADSIIKQHNGTMQLSNDALTGGARISIQFPLIE